MLGIFQKTIVNESGDIQDGATIEARDATTNTLVSLFADKNGVNPIANPFLTGSDGIAKFYTAPKKINVTAVKGSLSASFDDVWINDSMSAQEADDYATIAEFNGLEQSVSGLTQTVINLDSDVNDLQANAARTDAANTFAGQQTIIADGVDQLRLQTNYQGGVTTAAIRALGTGELDVTATALLLNGAPIDSAQANYVYVYSVSDLPTAAGGFHQLADNTNYVFVGQTTSANAIKMGVNTSLIGGTIYRDSFNYTGTGAAVLSDGNLIDINNVSIYAPNGTLFQKTAPSNLIIRRAILQAVNFGEVNVSSIFLADSIQCTLAGTGIVIGTAQPIPFLVMNLCTMVNQTTNDPLLDMTGATIGYATIQTGYWKPRNDISAPCIKGSPDSQGITQKVYLAANFFDVNPSQPILSGLQVKDIKVESKSNINLPDSLISGNAYLTGNAIATALTQNVPAIISGVWVGDTNNQRIDVDSSGRITFIGEGDHTMVVLVTGTVTNAGNGTADFKFQIRKNGATISVQQVVYTVQSGSNRAVAFQGQLQMMQGDYIDIIITNTTSNDNALVQDMQVVLRG